MNQRKSKIFLSIGLIILLSFSMISCSEKEEPSAYDNFVAAIDTDYSETIMTKLSEFGDDPDTGNRSAGSPAEHEAADYLYSTMKEMGLENVTKDAATVDGWTYKGANITYKDAEGNSQKVILGGYATTLVANNEEVPLVYLGEGTAADYEGVNVTGKLVLLDIDQNNNWWINYPAYQAKVKGAKAVIAMSILTEEDEDRIGSQDICGPADAPAFGISQKDSQILQGLLSASADKEITVTLNANSVVTPESTTYNVWGEIPGKTDDVIYLFGHYDGYYHSSFDNASGISTSLGIAKAIIDSGYVPDKTIRVVAHGAEEWGLTDSAYDWSMGSYKQITVNHPEWAKDGFAIINIDGGYPVEGENKLGISTSHELSNFVKESTEPVIDGSSYEVSWYMPASTGTEDLGWTEAGIPSIVAGEGEESIYFDNYYHCNTDSVSAAGFSEETYQFNHELYGKILMDLDALAVRPMDFNTRFTALSEVIDAAITKDEELTAKVDKAVEVSAALTEKVTQLNKDYIAANVAGKEEDAAKIKEEAAILNDALFHLYKNIQDDFLRISWGLEVVFPHENYQANVRYLSDAITALKSGDVAAAYDESISGIDYAWYATAFDQETYDYFVNQIYDRSTGTWGEGRIEYPICDLYGVVQSLGEKYDSKDANVTAEITALEKQLTIQQGYLDRTVADEKAALDEVTMEMEALLQ